MLDVGRARFVGGYYQDRLKMSLRQGAIFVIAVWIETELLIKSISFTDNSHYRELHCLPINTHI